MTTISPNSVTLSSGKTLWKALQEHRNWLENNYDDVRTRLDLTGETLDNVDFTGYAVDSARFASCSMKRCVFGYDHIYGVLFNTCDLTGTSFLTPKVQYTRFRSCTLDGCYFGYTSFDACSDYESTKVGTNFTGADVSEYSILYATPSDSYKGLLAIWMGTGVEIVGSTLQFGPLPQWRVVASPPADMT